jgi:hypothetical protein
MHWRIGSVELIGAWYGMGIGLRSRTSLFIYDAELIE